MPELVTEQGCRGLLHDPSACLSYTRANMGIP